MLIHGVYRSLVYVEGDASMNKFTAKDGTAQNALSIVQRESSSSEFFGWRAVLMGLYR